MSFGLPDVEVVEAGTEVVVRVKILEVDKSDIELEIRDDFFRVEVGRYFSVGADGTDCSFEGWHNCSFEGIMLLPCKVIPIVTDKNYVNGVLEVRMKKDADV